MDCIKDAMFLKTNTVTRNVSISPSIFPFMTMMTVDEKEGNLHPYVAPINHNELNNTKTKEIAYSILDYNSDGTQLSNLGNDGVVLVGFQNNVRLYILYYIFFVGLFILTHYLPLLYRLKVVALIMIKA